MAYDLTTGYTLDDIGKHILTKLGVIPVGGTVTTSQETELDFAINAALASLDSTNLYVGNTKRTVVSVSATTNVGSLSAITGIHSVLGGTLYQDSPQIYYPLELVPAQKLGAVGSQYINHVPTKFCAVLAGQPAAATNSMLVLNAAVQTASHIDMIYREALTMLTDDSGTLTLCKLPSAYLRLVILMAACDLAPSFGVEMSVRQELRALLTDAMNLAIAGAAGVEPGPAMRAAAAGQGTVSPGIYTAGQGIP